MSISAVTVLGIDPGYDRLGWAIATTNYSQPTILDYGCIQTSAKQSKQTRYLTIQTQLQFILSKYQPTHLALESVYFSKNKTTAIAVSEVRGLIIASCLPSITEFFEYNPSTIKKAVTGSGNADKRSMAKMVELQLKLPQGLPQLDDTVDALAIVLTHSLMVQQT